jgi:hypothetical protein
MQQYPEMTGRLTIRIFVAVSEPDQYGRLNGQWRTLFTRYLHRDDVPATLTQFVKANPGLHMELKNDNSHIDVSFVTREHFPL